MRELISFQNTKSGGGAQSLLLDCGAEVGVEVVLFHRRQYHYSYNNCLLTVHLTVFSNVAIENT